MKTSFLDKVAGMASTAICAVKKNSPTILVITGVVAGVGAAVGIGIASTKLSPIVEEAKESLDVIHKCAEDPEHKEDYAEQDIRRDTTIVYARATKEVVKLYSIPVSLGVLSLVSFLASYGILKKRNAAVTAAYVALDEGYKKYRARIINRFGEDVERRIRYGLKVEEIEEEIIDENGEKKVVKKTVEVPDDSDPSVVVTDEGVFTIDGSLDPSPYARYFDAASEYWEKDAEYNLKLLRDTEDYFNKALRYKRYIFLNEVYDKLGIQRSRAGQSMGWVYNPKLEGLKQIDFGIYNIYKPENRDFVNGYTRVVLLDFKGLRPIIDEVFNTDGTDRFDDRAPASNTIPVDC